MPQSPTSSSATFSGGGSVRAAALGVIALPWFIHAGVVGLSACGLRPLATRGVATLLLIGAVAGTAGLVAWARRGLVPAGSESSSADGWASRLASVLAVCAAAAFAWALAAALVWPVVAYDALSYRLPTIASWLDAGRIAWVYTDDPVRNGYPLGQEAVAAVLAAATGSFRFSAAVSFLHVAAGALALIGLAEECGVRRRFALAAGALFVLVPMVPLNAASGYVDAAFAGAMVALLCSAAGLALTLPLTRDARVAQVATGMAAAHVLSLKGNGVVFAGVVFVLLVGRALLTGPGTLKARVVSVPPWSLRLALPVLLALPGAFWFVRNVVNTRNPFWPVRMAIGGRVVFPGVATLEDIIDVVHNTPPEIAAAGKIGRVLRTWFELAGPASDFDARLAGMGRAWVLVAVPCIAWFLLRAPSSLSRARSNLGFVTAGAAVCFAIQPMNWWARYTLWLWAAGALAVVCVAETLARDGTARVLPAFLVVVILLAVPEGALATAYANGAATALARHGAATALAGGELRAPANATKWVDASFWGLGLADDRDVCRGFWKPNTDDANLDGVFAQLTPRPRVHVVNDEKTTWPAVRRGYEAQGCKRLLLFPQSPVLAAARNEPDLTVERVVAFDPLYLVRLRDPRVAASRVSP